MIFPLSNPASRSEEDPADPARWMDGRAMTVTRSPFSPLTTDGREAPVAQANNVCVFSAIGAARPETPPRPTSRRRSRPPTRTEPSARREGEICHDPEIRAVHQEHVDSRRLRGVERVCPFVDSAVRGTAFLNAATRRSTTRISGRRHARRPRPDDAKDVQPVPLANREGWLSHERVDAFHLSGRALPGPIQPRPRGRNDVRTAVRGGHRGGDGPRHGQRVRHAGRAAGCRRLGGHPVRAGAGRATA
ncbi:malic enzyme-like NAD(P)-binding protein [Streptomyces sp. NPDC087263]|uniref:malic enzyme-like NAD(P)-binding protein n=1 Tax=Streptomyces sp. NPDC087263 TaxID=3365773 RepID=UPI0038171928